MDWGTPAADTDVAADAAADVAAGGITAAVEPLGWFPLTPAPPSAAMLSPAFVTDRDGKSVARPSCCAWSLISAIRESPYASARNASTPSTDRKACTAEEGRGEGRGRERRTGAESKRRKGRGGVGEDRS